MLRSTSKPAAVLQLDCSPQLLFALLNDTTLMDKELLFLLVAIYTSIVRQSLRLFADLSFNGSTVLLGQQLHISTTRKLFVPSLSTFHPSVLL